jgi:hypothetical protein
MHEVRGDAVGPFEMTRLRSIIVAVVAAVAIIGAAMMRVEAARRIFPRCWFNEKTTEAGRDARP